MAFPTKTHSIESRTSPISKSDAPGGETKEPRKQNLKFNGVPTVDLRVGTEKILIHVHLGVLCSASPVFDAAFNGHFSESTDRSMDLPEDDPEAFERLVQWLYTKSFDIPPFKGDDCDDDQLVLTHLARLYVAADKYGIVGLKNDVIDHWFTAKEDSQVPDAELLKYVYANTTAKSKLRDLIVAEYVWELGFEWYRDDDSKKALCDLPEFAADLAIALATSMDNDDAESPFLFDSSQFHES